MAQQSPPRAKSSDAAASGSAAVGALPSDQDWLQSVHAALEQVAAQARDGTAPDTTAAASPAQPRQPAAALPLLRPDLLPRFIVPALGAAVAAALLFSGWRLLQRDDAPQRPATNAFGPAVLAPAASTAIATEPTAAATAPRSDARPAAPVQPTTYGEPGRALAQALAPLNLLDLRDAQVRVAKLLAAKGPARLALLRHDTLRQLPRSSAYAGLRVVAPLFVEPVQVWVPADSPLRGLQDLREARVDTGLDAGDAQSASHIGRALFGPRHEAVRQRHLADDEVLIALMGGEIDAVLRIRASTLTRQAAAAAGAGSLRPLPLDRNEPASARVLRDYRPERGGGLGVMNFLVVNGGSSAEREHLAAQALRRLCEVLPDLRAADASSWSGVRPEVALPAGRPYAAATHSAAAGCAAGSIGAAPAPARRPGVIAPQ
jgi:hypothetical protein